MSMSLRRLAVAVALVSGAACMPDLGVVSGPDDERGAFEWFGTVTDGGPPVPGVSVAVVEAGMFSGRRVVGTDATDASGHYSVRANVSKQWCDAVRARSLLVTVELVRAGYETVQIFTDCTLVPGMVLADYDYRAGRP